MKKLNILMSCLILCFLICLIKEPEICKNGILKGILLSGRVIIPSLFPFTVCVLFLQNAEFFKDFKFIGYITERLFGLTTGEFFIFLLSLIGGYPIGAKLLNESQISEKRASLMLNYCVNAGPAFIVSAVGFGILNSKEIGFVLLASHILSAVVICFVMRFFMPCSKKTNKKKREITPQDNFVLSTYKSAETIFSICSFVIFFSGINAYLERSALKPALFILEVTNAVTYTKNIYLISFLLGFSGVCVWFQVISLAKNIKINFSLFLLCRISQGILSAVFSFMIIKIFRVSLPSLSSGANFGARLFYSTPQLSISLFIMAMLFIISLKTKKYAGKIMDDVI